MKEGFGYDEVSGMLEHAESSDDDGRGLELEPSVNRYPSFVMYEEECRACDVRREHH